MARLREALAITCGACLVPFLLIAAAVMWLGDLGSEPDED